MKSNIINFNLIKSNFKCQSTAHCHNIPSDMRNYRILIGMHTINNPIESQIYTPIDFLVHPSYIYNDKYDTYDMSIIIVDRAIEFNPFVKPICLPMDYDDELFWNHKVIAAGKFQPKLSYRGKIFKEQFCRLGRNWKKC